MKEKRKRGEERSTVSLIGRENSGRETKKYIQWLETNFSKILYE